MAWLALMVVAVSFGLVYKLPVSVPIVDSEYLSLAALAGLDALVGGIRAGTEGKFKANVFVSGFVFNTLLAAFLAYLGERLGQDIALSAVVLLGGRTFVNLSIIRRHWLDSHEEVQPGQVQQAH
jgi:small basic protein